MLRFPNARGLAFDRQTADSRRWYPGRFSWAHAHSCLALPYALPTTHPLSAAMSTGPTRLATVLSRVPCPLGIGWSACGQQSYTTRVTHCQRRCGTAQGADVSVSRPETSFAGPTRDGDATHGCYQPQKF